MSKSIIGAIDGDKLLEWIENNPEADGFWNGEKSRESFDALTDAMYRGQLSSSDQGEATRLREALHRITDVLSDDTSLNAQRINNIVIQALSLSHREETVSGWQDITDESCDPERDGYYLVTDGKDIWTAAYAEGIWGADLVEVTHWMPHPPIPGITEER